MTTVYAIYGDIGGAKETLPAMQAVSKKGVVVRHFVSGDRARAGIDVLDKALVPYETRGPQTDDKPALIVVGTNATAVQGQIGWTKFGRDRGIPVLWIEDLWGAGETEKTQVVSPDTMCVIDTIAGRIAQNVRPHMQVNVVGKPSFAALAKKLENLEESRATTRAQLAARLGITNFNGHIVTYGSGGEVPTRVYIHLQALRDLGLSTNKEVIFVPRFHPKLSDDDKQHVRILSFTVGTYVVMAHDLDMDFITVSSDVNIGEWGSTTMYTSVLFGVPAIMCMFPDDRGRRLALGYPNGVPPLLMAEAGRGPTDITLLHDALNEILCAPEQYREMTRKNGAVFRTLLEPGAEDRIAEVVMSYL